MEEKREKETYNHMEMWKKGDQNNHESLPPPYRGPCVGCRAQSEPSISAINDLDIFSAMDGSDLQELRRTLDHWLSRWTARIKDYTPAPLGPQKWQRAIHLSFFQNFVTYSYFHGTSVLSLWSQTFLN